MHQGEEAGLCTVMFMTLRSITVSKSSQTQKLRTVFFQLHEVQNRQNESAVMGFLSVVAYTGRTELEVVKRDDKGTF